MATWDRNAASGTNVTEVKSDGTSVKYSDQSTTGSTSSTNSSSTAQHQLNADPASIQALQQLIQQLASGGTAEQKASVDKKNELWTTLSNALSSYSKQSGITDAQSLMAQELQKSLEANMPTITKSIDNAGTSAGSMQALLAQDLATKTANAAGALGVSTATQYGQIASNLASILEKLTHNDTNSVENQLVSAFQALKGAAIDTTNTTSNTSYSTSQQDTSGTTITQSAPDVASKTVTPLYDSVSSTDVPSSAASNTPDNSNPYMSILKTVYETIDSPYTYNNAN